VHRLLGKNVLLIDLDPQQNLTELFLTPAQLEAQKKQHLSIIGMFEPQKIKKDEDIFDPFGSSCTEGRDHVANVQALPITIGEASGEKVLDLLAGQFEAIKYTEIPADERESAIYNFKRGLEALKRRYDYIFVDCNPSASLLSKAALNSVDNVFCPIRPDDSARRGLLFMDRATRDFYRPTPTPELLIAFNFVRTRPSQTEKDLIKWLRDGDTNYFPKDMTKFVGKYLTTEVPESDALRSRYASSRRGAGSISSLLGTFRSSNALDIALDNLARELVKRLEQGAKHAEESSRAS
jgi:cellulose biosynthesis protein BcsQ